MPYFPIEKVGVFPVQKTEKRRGSHSAGRARHQPRVLAGHQGGRHELARNDDVLQGTS